MIVQISHIINTLRLNSLFPIISEVFEKYFIINQITYQSAISCFKYGYTCKCLSKKEQIGVCGTIAEISSSISIHTFSISEIT